MEEAHQLLTHGRVNIQLDVAIGDSQEQKELPCKLLMLGHYGGRYHQQQLPLDQRDRIKVNKNNFNQVINAICPQLTLTVGSHRDQQQIQLTFQCLNDFSPEHLVQQIPSLAALLAMRNLLKELKSCLLDNQRLQKYLTMIQQDREKLQMLQKQLAQLIPMTA